MQKLVLLLWAVFFLASGVARYWVVQPRKRRPQPLQSNEPWQLIGGLGLLCLLAGCFLWLNLTGHAWRVSLFLAGGIAYDLTLRWYFVGREAYRFRQRAHCSRRTAVRTVRGRAGYRPVTDFLPAGLRHRLPVRHQDQETDLGGDNTDPFVAS
jgi:hypothetical protein